mmetsp:Transcript_52788/g.150468  ORF Transcript_52788/g.150468 Transcript_52788/m.150468 type:complete len:222 (+) Transcript_52788:157-822(+)
MPPAVETNIGSVHGRARTPHGWPAPRVCTLRAPPGRQHGQCAWGTLGETGSRMASADRLRRRQTPHALLELCSLVVLIASEAIFGAPGHHALHRAVLHAMQSAASEAPVARIAEANCSGQAGTERLLVESTSKNLVGLLATLCCKAREGRSRIAAPLCLHHLKVGGCASSRRGGLRNLLRALGCICARLCGSSLFSGSCLERSDALVFHVAGIGQRVRLPR